VPLLFAPYASDLAARIAAAGVPEGGVVLETAAGTGVLTRALDAALAAGVRIVATDLNEGMLIVARERRAGSGAGARDVTFQQADAQRLPFPDAAFDAVVAQFGMMFLPDRRAGYREALRVLRPEGRFVFNVWGRLADNEVSKIVSDVAIAAFPDDPPRFIERTPFGYFDRAVIRADLEAAGFAQITIDDVDATTHASAADVAAGLCQATPLRNEIEARDPARLDAITAEAARALEKRFGATVENRMRAIVLAAQGRER